MASLMNKITQLSRSPKGQQLMDRAQRMARDPETKRKITEARGKLAKRRSGGANEPPPHGTNEPPPHGANEPPPGRVNEPPPGAPR